MTMKMNKKLPKKTIGQTMMILNKKTLQKSMNKAVVKNKKAAKKADLSLTVEIIKLVTISTLNMPWLETNHVLLTQQGMLFINHTIQKQLKNSFVMDLWQHKMANHTSTSASVTQ